MFQICNVKLNNILQFFKTNIHGLFCCRWGKIEFPMPFGRVMSATEALVHELDEKVHKYT